MAVLTGIGLTSRFIRSMAFRESLKTCLAPAGSPSMNLSYMLKISLGHIFDKTDTWPLAPIARLARIVLSLPLIRAKLSLISGDRSAKWLRSLDDSIIPTIFGISASLATRPGASPDRVIVYICRQATSYGYRFEVAD